MTLVAAGRGRIGPLDLDIGFSAAAGTVTALAGPSGAGKTTILRWLAGLVRIDGEVRVDGTAWQAASHFVPPHRRRAGLVFQGQGLLPQLSVAGNLAYAAARAPAPLARDAIVAATGIAGLLDRRPASLSGGEAQRAGIARALIGRPRLLLLDEPLAALDPAARAELGAMLARLLPQLDMIVLLVSHDAGEVARLARKVIRIEAGRTVDR